MENVGFIGLGIMGKPMAHNLLKAGVDLTVCDLNQDAVNELVAAGAKSGSYKEIGESYFFHFRFSPFLYSAS